MKRWIICARVEPPANVVMARSGGSVFDVCYDRMLRRWVHVIPGAGEEIIPEPEWLFVDEQWVRDNPRKTFIRPAKVRACRKKKAEQLWLL